MNKSKALPNEPRWLNLYVVIDTKAETIIGPVVHDASYVPITRQITEAVNNPKSLIGQNPEDFAIFQIGRIDEKTGYIEAFEVPELLTQAIVLRHDPQ